MSDRDTFIITTLATLHHSRLAPTLFAGGEHTEQLDSFARARVFLTVHQSQYVASVASGLYSSRDTQTAYTWSGTNVFKRTH